MSRCLRIVFFSSALMGWWLCPCVVNSEWIQVPLIQTHEKQLDLALQQEQRIPSSIADKLEELAVSLRSDRNKTKQMDLELDLMTTTTSTTPTPPLLGKRRRVDTQVTKTRNTEPFSIFGFLRSFRDSFFFKSQASVKQKVGFLERIRNNILSEISEWPLTLWAVCKLIAILQLQSAAFWACSPSRGDKIRSDFQREMWTHMIDMTLSPRMVL